jgi:hypothetical protein
MKIAAILLSLAAAVSLSAEEFEKIMLPVAPSVVHCGYHSKYDTRLVAYNDADRSITQFGLGANTGTVVEGEHVAVPNPAFLYVPRSEAAKLQMSLIVESSDRARPEERSYTELPIVRESDFRSSKIQIVGVRMDDGFRKTLRIYGLDGSQWTAVRVRVFPLDSNVPAYEHEYALVPSPQFADGRDSAPSFNMECDLSDYVSRYDRPARVEVEPLTPGARIWAFVSVTNNVTQHFYTVVPR